MTERMEMRIIAGHGRSWAPAQPTDAEARREDALRSRVRKLLTSGVLHPRPWRLATHVPLIESCAVPCLICSDRADTLFEELASRFTAAAHAEPCGRLWIEEALGVQE